MSTEEMRVWLERHRAAIEAGVNVGQIDRDRAQKFWVEIARREGVWP